MIQRMNNVLLKHSKILFGVITIVIIISFVWFLTPGADGSLLFSGGSGKMGEVFGEKLEIKDLEAARDAMILVQAPDVYAHNPAAVRRLGGNIEEMQMFQMAALIKAAHLHGYTASDAEVGKEISALPAFQKDGQFSQVTYDEFKNGCLTPNGFTFKDFENAFRAMIMLRKFQASAAAGVSVTDDEVERAAQDAAVKVTNREFIFSADAFERSVKITDDDIKAAYEADLSKYMSDPVSDALMIYVNLSDVKAVAPVSDAQVDEQFKAFGSMMKDKDGKALAEKDARAQIRSELEKQAKMAAAAQKLNAFYLKAYELVREEGFTPAVLKKEAEAAGFKVAALVKLTAGSPETVIAGSRLIQAVNGLTDVNTFTQPMPNKDSFAFAMLTNRIAPRQLTLDEAKAEVRDNVLVKKSLQLAQDAARALRAEVLAGKLTADKIEAAVQAATGKKPAPAKESVKLTQIAEAYGQYKTMAMNNPYLSGSLLGYLKNALLQENFAKGFISEPMQASADSYSMFYVVDSVPVPEAVTDKAKEAIRELLLNNKQELAMQDWFGWINANTKCFMRSREQQQAAE